MGKYEISRNALIQFVEITALKSDGVNKVNKVRIDSRPEGVIIDVEVSLRLVKRLDLMMKDIQALVKEKLEYATGLNVIAINIFTVGLVISDKGLYIGDA